MAAAWGVTSLRPAVAPLPQPTITVRLVEVSRSSPIPPAPPAPPKRQAGSGLSPSRSQPQPERISAPLEAVAPSATVAPRPTVAAVPPAQAPALPLVLPAAATLDDFNRRVWAHLAEHAPTAPPGSGTAVVVFRLDAQGNVLFVRLARSSGRPDFDRACLASVRSASPLPKPPEGTRPEELAFTVPIRAAQRP